MRFDLDSETRRRLGYRLIDHVDQYFSSLPERAVQLPAEKRSFPPLDAPLPEEGADAAQVLEEVAGELVERGFHVPSANYYGLMNCTPTYAAVLAEALVAALNPQLASPAHSQMASAIERQTLRWIGGRVGWTGAFDGTFTSGGNEANFTGLALAVAHHFPQTVEEGVAAIGAPPVLYTSSEAHHSIDKSVGLLGLGRKALRRIAVTERLQLDPQKLEAAIDADLAAGRKPFCVVATAGTTNSGAVDDLIALADIAQRHNLWLHLDGAYGASAIFSDKHRDAVRGVERCDSVILDPHKWLAMPFATGVILTSRPEALERAFAVRTPYMPKASELESFKVSAQWSRRMNSLKLYLTLRMHGRKAYEELIDRQFALARRFADWVEKAEAFELAAPLYLPIVNFRVRPAWRPSQADPRPRSEEEIAAANETVVEAVTHDGRRWISSTRVAGRSVIRMMVISYLTEERHLDDLQAALAVAAHSLRT